MFLTADYDYYLSAEMDYKRERIARDWGQANRRRRTTDRRRFLRLPKRPTLKLPPRQSGDVAVA